MIELVCARTRIDRYQAYTLCSLAVDLRVTQVVNGNKGVHAMPRKTLSRASQLDGPLQWFVPLCTENLIRL